MLLSNPYLSWQKLDFGEEKQLLVFWTTDYLNRRFQQAEDQFAGAQDETP